MSHDGAEDLGPVFRHTPRDGLLPYSSMLGHSEPGSGHIWGDDPEREVEVRRLMAEDGLTLDEAIKRVRG